MDIYAAAVDGIQQKNVSLFQQSAGNGMYSSSHIEKPRAFAGTIVENPSWKVSENHLGASTSHY